MKITHYRDPKGKFAQKGNTKIVLILIVLALIGVLYGYFKNGKGLEPWQVNSDTSSVGEVSSDDLTAEQIAQLKLQADLAMREQIALNKKAKSEEEFAKIEAQHKADIAAIEADLSDIRSQKVTSFTSAKTQ